MPPPAEWGSDSTVSVTWSVVSSSFSCSVASSRQCTVGRARWSPVQWSGPGTRTLVTQVQVNSRAAEVPPPWPTPALASNTRRQHPVLLLVQGETRTLPRQRNCQCFVKADKCAAADTCHTVTQCSSGIQLIEPLWSGWWESWDYGKMFQGRHLHERDGCHLIAGVRSGHIMGPVLSTGCTQCCWGWG